MNRSEAKKFLDSMILTSNEVQEVLMINRSRLGALVVEGKLNPLKKLKGEHLFWLPDVEAYKDVLMKDTRSNLYKKAQ